MNTIRFEARLDRYGRSCNTLNYLPNKVYVPNKIEDLNLHLLIWLSTGINESKILTKHTSREYKFKFDGRKCNLNQKQNNNKCWCECKNIKCVEKDYIWNPAACSY